MARHRPVWGYFALALVCACLGIVALLASFDDGFPAQASLKSVSGKVATVRIVDELSGQPIGLNTPLNGIHFTLENDETVYRYPSGWPGYSALYERLAFTVEVWVDPQDLSSGEPVSVYALEQTVPSGWPHPAISIDYPTIIGSQRTVYETYRTLAIVALVLSPILFAIGYAMVIRNRRHRAIPKPD